MSKQWGHGFWTGYYQAKEEWRSKAEWRWPKSVGCTSVWHWCFRRYWWRNLIKKPTISYEWDDLITGSALGIHWWLRR
jgi:hypothetical protein